MKIVTQVSDWIKIRQQLQGKTIGFVPTMGHLHLGHLNLCEKSKRENQVTIVSIFVNPMQFNDPHDFEQYPRTLAEDYALLFALQIDYVFLPAVKDIYREHEEMLICENDMSKVLEGKFRPGHFDGMLTVVLKLLNLTQATRAYFGEKDFQQLMLIKKMVNAFFIPTEIVACETVRAANGLALSSRNSRLNAQQREQAAELFRCLSESSTCTEAYHALCKAGFKVDYVEDKWNRRLGAIWLDGIRLIDNIPLNKWGK